jgi:inorganic pyrophosphatase/exopolyphosphatase
MGNESCDLDSAISALVYAYLLYSEISANAKETVAVIPLLNIFKKELSLKTEVMYYLSKNGIPLDLLVFQLVSVITRDFMGKIVLISEILETQFKSISHLTKSICP